MLPILGALGSAACAGDEEERPAAYQYNASPTKPDTTAQFCALPNEGCPCDAPGEIRDCGTVRVTIDRYETCYEGSRICNEAGLWSACASDQAIAQLVQ